MRVRANHLVDSLCRLFAAVGLVTLILYAAATVLNGLTRSLLDMPIDFVSDVASLVVAVSVASCLPIALWQKANITIDLIPYMLPSALARAVRLAASLIILVATTAIARQLFVYARNTALAGDSTVMLEIPAAPFWFYVAAMAAIAALVQLVVFLNDVAGVTSRDAGGPSPAAH